MKPVPTYSLYGTSSSEPLLDQLHFESIAQRSKLHGWEIQPHRHERFLQILYIHAGGGEALLDGSREALRGGSLVMVPPQHIHGFVFRPETDGIVVTMTDSHLRTLLAGVPDTLPLFERPRHDRVRRDDALADALLLFRGEMESVSAWRGAALSALLTVVLIGIARLADASAPARRAATAGRRGTSSSSSNCWSQATANNGTLATMPATSASPARSSTASAGRWRGSPRCR